MVANAFNFQSHFFFSVVKTYCTRWGGCVGTKLGWEAVLKQMCTLTGIRKMNLSPLLSFVFFFFFFSAWLHRALQFSFSFIVSFMAMRHISFFLLTASALLALKMNK